MVSSCWCHQTWDGHWNSSACSTRESILSPPQSWRWQQVWCVSCSKKTRFHLLSQLGCSDQAWSCLAGTPQQTGLYDLHYIMPVSSYSALLGPPFPWSSLLANEQLIPKYFCSTGLTFVISIHKSGRGEGGWVCVFLSHLILVWYFRCALLSL